MKYIRAAYRLILLAIHVVVGLVLTATVLRKLEGKPPKDNETAIIGWWMRRSCTILGLKIKVDGAAHAAPALVVSNHISWLDIPVLGSVIPVAFVSKIEVRAWPMIGILAARSGTLFIQRGGKNAANLAAEQVAFRLRQGRSVAIFPEGTTGDGHTVRRFHPRLLGAAVHAETYIQPAAIRYPHPQGVHPAAPFVANDNLFRHLLRVLSEKRIEAEVTLCRRLASQPVDRRTLAEQAHAAIRQVVEERPAAAQTRQKELSRAEH